MRRATTEDLPELSKMLFIKPLLKEEYALEILEQVLLKEEQVHIPVKEFIHDGIYVREIFIPKGTLAIGNAHPNSFIETVSKGKVVMFSDDSEKTIIAPFTRVAQAGKKKFGLATEDTIWTTYHKVTSNNIGDAYNETVDLSNAFIEDSKKDYVKLLQELKITEIQTQEDMKILGEIIPIGEQNHIYKDNSNINGIGFFAKINIEKGFLIGIGILNDKKTDLGRYINHSPFPNVEIKVIDNNICVISKRNILKNEELLINYRDNLKKEYTCLQ